MPLLPRICPDLEFDPAGHRYFRNGVELRSVTTILAEEGLADTRWFTDAHREAGVRRHIYTEAVDLFDAGDLDESDLDENLRFAVALWKGDAVGRLQDPTREDEIRATVAAWRQFRADSGFVPEYIEERVFSDYGFAGTIDRAGLLGDGSLAIPDAKGPSLMAATGVQLWLYAQAFKERTGRTPVRRISVHIHPDGSYVPREHNDRADLAAGLAAVSVNNWKRLRGVGREERRAA